MEAKELRVGNFINVCGCDDRVEVINSINDTVETLSYSDVEISESKPIPLTEERLQKLGFEEVKIDHPIPNHKAFEHSNLHIKIYNNSPVIKSWYKESVIDLNIQHVHQLQNLYFALTGQELEIKEPRTV